MSIFSEIRLNFDINHQIMTKNIKNTNKSFKISIKLIFIMEYKTYEKYYKNMSLTGEWFNLRMCIVVKKFT